MANALNAFVERLIAAAGDYNAATVGQLSYLDAVYMDVRSEVARNGQTITVNFPDFGPLTDIGVGDLVISDVNAGSFDLTFSEHPCGAFKVADFEQYVTAPDIKEKFLDPMYKRAAEYINGRIAGLITPTNFNVNPVIQAAKPGQIAVQDQLNAWNVLANQKVPLENAGDLNLLTHNDVYRNLLGDSQWTQESLVGVMIAQQARERAQLRPAFNFLPRWDQQAPRTATPIAGTIAVTQGSAAVVGTGTNFATALAEGQYVTFAGDALKGTYRIKTITNGTNLVLETPYTGANLTTSAASGLTYYSLAAHRYAIAVGLRPLQAPSVQGNAMYLPIVYKGIPLRLIISWQHLKMGTIISVDFGFALGVMRKEFGTLIRC